MISALILDTSVVEFGSFLYFICLYFVCLKFCVNSAIIWKTGVVLLGNIVQFNISSQPAITQKLNCYQNPVALVEFSDWVFFFVGSFYVRNPKLMFLNLYIYWRLMIVIKQIEVRVSGNFGFVCYNYIDKDSFGTAIHCEFI